MKLISLLYEVVTQAFFDKVRTPEEAKALYRELAKKYHPDKGGSTEIMQAINNQYQQFLKNPNRRQSSTTQTPRDTRADDYFRAGAAADKKWADRKAQKEKEYQDREAGYAKSWKERNP